MKVGSVQVCEEEVGSPEVCLSKVCPGEVGAPEVGLRGDIKVVAVNPDYPLSKPGLRINRFLDPLTLRKGGKACKGQEGQD